MSVSVHGFLGQAIVGTAAAKAVLAIFYYFYSKNERMNMYFEFRKFSVTWTKLMFSFQQLVLLWASEKWPANFFLTVG